MDSERTIRVIAFVVFFSVGAAVLSATVLCDDIAEYFYNKSLLKQAEANLHKMESLNADYNALIGRLEGNPKELARLAPATLGMEPNVPGTAYPRATADKLAAARRALTEEPNASPADMGVPIQIILCCQWPRRHILFICGATLMLISFIFFGPTKDPSRTMKVTSNPPESPQPPETQ